MPKLPLYYTFGNHMHWVDMQWLWGYDVLPGSVRDMITLCRQAGVKGNVNFDAIGYEKMAAECPEALAELKSAAQEGLIEPVGCSYGQPYGLFHGGESNIRQLTYGVRATMRHLGVRPRTFWEEEFYFFPQLPQLLASAGYTGACLFFQWTWHTPELPKEPHSLILWQGIDGTTLPTLPRNNLNVHQWPEDFDGLLSQLPLPEGGGWGVGSLPPAVVQWLELMPSKDWMCRSELLLPRLKELLADPRFELRPRTASNLITELHQQNKQPPTHHYTMDQVWHGMTLGKNADSHPRASAYAQSAITAAESTSALATLFGRPYASWDLYPTWELEQATALTLAAQHHDNHECEGLCGFIGHQQFDAAHQSAHEVLGRVAWLLSQRAGSHHARDLLINGLGWPRKLRDFVGAQGEREVVATVPAFGYLNPPKRKAPSPKINFRRARNTYSISRGGFRIEVDPHRGVIKQILCAGKPLLGASASLCELKLLAKGRSARLGPPQFEPSAGQDFLRMTRECGLGKLALTLTLDPDSDAVIAKVDMFGPQGWPELFKPEAGLNASLQLALNPGFATLETFADSPFAVHQVRGSETAKRKYPTADWMTSAQWFEELHRPFTASTFVDLIDPSQQKGLLVAHDGSQQFFRDPDGVRAVLTAYDPWDEGRYGRKTSFGAGFKIIPHDDLTNAQRIKWSHEFVAAGSPQLDDAAEPVGGGTAYGVDTDIPKSFGALSIENAPNILAHAFFRESMKSGENLPLWAGHRMFKESQGACDHPFVIRLTEWNGDPAEVTLKLPGPIALAAKTNIMGEVGSVSPAAGVGDVTTLCEGQRGRGGNPSAESLRDTHWIDIEHPVDPPTWAADAKLKGEPITWSALRFTMRPREVATIYADLLMGRKQWRDLDAKRKVWATVHKTK